MTNGFLKGLAVAGMVGLIAACSSATGAVADESETTGTSEEALTAREATTGDQTIRGYYRDALGREPSDAEAAIWEPYITSHGYQFIAQTILGSPEGRRKLVTDYYRTFLRREPDAGGLAAFSNNPRLAAGFPQEALAILLGSAEYFVLNGSNNVGYVSALYRDLLGRGASAADIQWWAGIANRNRTEAAKGFLGTDEYRNRLVATWYPLYLRRAADPGGLAYFSNNLKANRSQFEVLGSMLATPEYQTLHHVAVCQPRSCAQLGVRCGVTNDGCGHQISCGGCGGGQQCSGNQCITTCQPRSCAQVGAQCGVANDGCGHQINCGGCGNGQQCSGTQCISTCQRKTCAQTGVECGVTSDGCGGSLSCGGCSNGKSCVMGSCVFVCQPQTREQACAPGVCGSVDAGCGQEYDCGGCANGSICGADFPNTCSEDGGVIGGGCTCPLGACGFVPNPCSPGAMLYCGRCG